jgi:heme/copper-type cytochrome/quinol oxidase subunit 2
MDLVVIAAALIAALTLSRGRALTVAVVVWCPGVAMVAWGPANNESVDTGSLGFWGPWAIVLVVEVLLVVAVDRVRRRRVAAS